jgi:hypothetical protein
MNKNIKRKELIMDTGTCAVPAGLQSYNPPNVIDQLMSRRDDLNKRLEEVNRAISILEKNPELSDLLSIVRRNI